MLNVSISVDIESNFLVSLVRRLPRKAEGVVDTVLDAGYQNVTQGMLASGSPSAPGSYPGIDQGILFGSIMAVREGRSGALISDTPYDAYLEYGTSRMEARPFMTPAAEHMRQVMTEELARFGGDLVAR